MRWALLTALVALLAPITVRGQETLIDQVVATVDKDVILYTDLLAQIGGALENLRQTATSQEEFARESDKLITDALDNSIEQFLLAREARKYPNLAVSDKELEDQIDLIRQNENIPTEQFVAKIGGSMSEFRETTRTKMLASRMSYVKTNEFEKDVSIAAQDINNYYEEHIDDYQRPERVYVRQMFLRVRGDEAERAAAREKLEGIRRQILNGADFQEMAKQYSEISGAELGGAIGWQRRDELVEPLSSTAFSLPAGGVSEVLDTQFGVNLLKVDEREDAGVTPLSEAALSIEEELRKEAADKKFDTWMLDLRKRSRVRVFLPR